ncbi:helix-turn-helix domain-containing protein [Streptomyces sp. NBC_01476]|uniref:helix-turn-helix domain-containing protein n=1 Tax=Streptomyces sp. NBC_01476 TaxID=2903881 RepID=UPI002E37116C|nr:helix-turn-helix domain-containing protein [Streptomyces sp. NBC_01476]
MNVRPAVAALVATGHTDSAIADQLGIHRTTAYRTRRRITDGHQTPLDRLLAEALPTGRIADYGPVPRRAWTPAEQAAHRAELLAALRPARPSAA